MRIRGWHVDGFGIHRDWSVDELSQGLNVFYGPNEAGKSTLLAFLRGVLFGYPDGRSSEAKYLPKGGGVHGGRVLLRGASGDVVVERFAGRGQKVSVTLEDGRAGDVAALAERLGHADARLFRTVFAFGLPELQKLGSLGEAGIQDHILAAGVTGGGRSAREAVQELRESARDLFDGPKGRKKNDRARVLVREIAELNSELFVRQEAAERYPDLCDVEQALAARMLGLEAEADAERAVGRRARRLVELWSEVWSPLAEAREQAAKLAPSVPEALPVDARERLEASLQQVQRDEERLEVLRAERAAVAEQLSELRLDEAARAVALRVDGLQDRLALHRNQCARLDELDVQVAACADRLEAALARLFPGAPGDEAETRLLAVQSSALRREELREWKTRVDEVVAHVRDAEAVVRSLAEQREEPLARVRALDEALAGEAAIDRDGIARRVEAVRSLRSLSPKLREREADVALRTGALAAHASGQGLLPGAGVPIVLAVVLTIVAGVAGVLAQRTELAAIAGILCGALAVVSVGFGVFRTRRLRRASEADREALEQAALAAGSRVEDVRTEAAPQLAVLGLDLWDEEGLSRVESRLEDERAQAEAIGRKRDELREARSQLSRLEGQQTAELDRVRRAQQRRDAIDADFAGWKAQVALPAALGVEAAAEFLEEARRGRDALDERDRLTAERQRVTAEIATWRADVDLVLAEARVSASVSEMPTGEGGDAEAGRVAALAALAARCRADRAAREGREPLERRATDLRDRFAMVEGELLVSRGALDALLREAGSADVAELQRAIGVADEAKALERRAASGEDELRRRLAAVGEAEADALREELPAGAVDAWHERAAEAEARVARIRAERDGVLREHQDRARDRERLEESTDVMDLELRKSALEEELRGVLEEWRRLRLAAELLEEALRRFEEAHQPGVLRDASTLFAQVTGGRYPRIVQSDSDGFAVVAADGTHRGPGELSQGTTEQLYLCIRLGLVAELARNDRALPVVMDDVLVNFDDDRARAMAGVLAVFASEHQLLFFTCSSRTRDLLAAAAPDAAVRAIGSTV